MEISDKKKKKKLSSQFLVFASKFLRKKSKEKSFFFPKIKRIKKNYLVIPHPVENFIKLKNLSI